MRIRRLTPAACVAVVATAVWAGGINLATAAGEEGPASSNPLSGNKEAEGAGQTTYRANCALCHGMRADGRGRGLPNSADLRKFKRGYTKFVQAVKEGYKRMPAWGGMGALTDQQIAEIGAYLETLARRNANWVDPEDRSEAVPAGGIMRAVLRMPGPTALERGIILATTTTEPKEYQVHLGHLLTSWSDTPGEVGLVTVLEQEATIAGEHAGYAVLDLEDLANIQLHTRHVRHAVDPTAEQSGEGPGMSYGIVKAAAGVIQHMEFARDASDASASARLHAEHVITAARNIQFWAGKTLDKAGQVIGGASPVASAFYAEEIVERIDWILNGRDANGDGTITWEDGEGGLAQIKEHLSYIE